MTIDGASFSPVDLTVAVGESIVWVNGDPYPHTATARTGGIDSRTIASGKSWKYTANTKGDFPFVCTLHPSITGAIHVT